MQYRRPHARRSEKEERKKEKKYTYTVNNESQERMNRNMDNVSSSYHLASSSNRTIQLSAFAEGRWGREEGGARSDLSQNYRRSRARARASDEYVTVRYRGFLRISAFLRILAIFREYSCRFLPRLRSTLRSPFRYAIYKSPAGESSRASPDRSIKYRSAVQAVSVPPLPFLLSSCCSLYRCEG